MSRYCLSIIQSLSFDRSLSFFWQIPIFLLQIPVFLLTDPDLSFDRSLSSFFWQIPIIFLLTDPYLSFDRSRSFFWQIQIFLQADFEFFDWPSLPARACTRRCVCLPLSINNSYFHLTTFVDFCFLSTYVHGENEGVMKKVVKLNIDSVDSVNWQKKCSLVNIDQEKCSCRPQWHFSWPNVK